MKWKNPGREFISYEKYFKGKKIFIYGAGARGEYLYNRLKKFSCVEGFIDNNTKYLDKDYLGEKVIRFRDIDDTFINKYIVVIAAQKNIALLFLKQCRTIGFTDGKNLFHYDDFMNYYVDLFLFYSKGLVFAEFISCQITSVCNLRCEGCLAFTPQNKHQHHFEIEETKRRIDLIFENIDYVHIFDLCGGEPFLFNRFPEVIRYISAKYGERIEMLRTVSNGTVVPSDDLCETLQNCSITVLLDDYRESVDLSRKNFEKVVSKLDKYNAKYIVNKVPFWIDLEINTIEKTNGIEDTIRRHDECQDNMRAVLGDKIYACDYAGYAVASGVIDTAECMDLMQIENKAIMLEFLKGYTYSGHAGMCKYCNGCTLINQSYIAVANQQRTIGRSIYDAS